MKDKCKVKMNKAEIDIINSPFSKALGWINKKGKITRLGRDVIKGVCKKRK